MPNKYTDQQYVDCNFYGNSECESHYEAKVVKIRKERKCVNCHHKQKAGASMLRETAIVEDMGRRSAHTCVKCLDRWLDTVNRAGVAGKF